MDPDIVAERQKNLRVLLEMIQQAPWEEFMLPDNFVDFKAAAAQAAVALDAQVFSDLRLRLIFEKAQREYSGWRVIAQKRPDNGDFNLVIVGV